jgi:serine/threonine protein kinase
VASKNIKHIQNLFEQVVDLSPKDRQTFLEKACGDDTVLLKTILDLLNADENKHSIFQEEVMDLINQEQTHTYINSKIGAYKIIQELGKGGMGVVFLAERDDGEFDQKVAVKLLKYGMGNQEIFKRFQSERQILARLQHPNIARLLDGGVTDDGLPFFTMEYVQGVAIDSYCNQQKLSLSERLKLFQTVCSAVQYAHRNLLIHRDLKPGNIFVSADGDIKLLDFGIAKALSNVEGPEMAVLTQAGDRVMTPEYASPEQARGEGVGTATDIYSLGVVLYELLTGLRPYEFEQLSPAKIEQVICNTEPKKPSSAISKLMKDGSKIEKKGTTLKEVSADRKNQPERIVKDLTGDLDNICMKALKKEPEQRYESVEQFRLDISRYLEGFPVKARPDTLTYRSRKFIKRNQFRLAISGGIFLLISIFLVFHTVRLASERDRAQLEAQKAEQVSDFLKGLFEISNPRESKGETISARELLDRGAIRLEKELAEQPAVQAEMIHVIGEVYGSIGLFEKADSMLNNALDLRRKLYDDDHPEVAKTLGALGVHYEVLGRFEEAASMHRSAIAILRIHANDKPLALAASLHSMAHAQMRLHNLDDAESLIREALMIKRKHLGSIHQDVAYSLNILGDVHDYQGRPNEAERVHREVLEMRRELLGPDHLDVANTLHNLAAALKSQRRYVEAEATYLEALRLWKKNVGNENSEVGNSLSQLAFVVGQQGRHEEAETMHLEALSILRRVFGEGHPRIATAFERYGNSLVTQGQYKKAEEAYRECLEIRRNTLGNEHPNVASALIRVGVSVWKQARYDEAEQVLQEGYKLCNSLPDCIGNPIRWELAQSSLFDFYDAWGRPEERQKYAKQ